VSRRKSHHHQRHHHQREQDTPDRGPEGERMREGRSRTEDTTGVCFETHPAGASRRYSGRYKPATKSSVCDTLIIGHIYGVHIVLADTQARDRHTHTHTYTQTHTRLDVYICSHICACAFAYAYVCQRVSYTCMRECSGDDCWKIIGISGTA